MNRLLRIHLSIDLSSGQIIHSHDSPFVAACSFITVEKFGFKQFVKVNVQHVKNLQLQ